MPKTDLDQAAQAIRNSWSLLRDLTDHDIRVVAILSCLVGDDQFFDQRGQGLETLLDQLGIELTQETLARLRERKILGNSGPHNLMCVQYGPGDWAPVRQAFKAAHLAKYCEVNELLCQRVFRRHMQRSAYESLAVYTYRLFPKTGIDEISKLLRRGSLEECKKFLELISYESR